MEMKVKDVTNKVKLLLVYENNGFENDFTILNDFYDSALIGYFEDDDGDFRAVYSRNKLIECLVNHYKEFSIFDEDESNLRIEANSEICGLEREFLYKDCPPIIVEFL